MIDRARVLEILEKLRPATEQEGLEVEFLGISGNTLELKARRRQPGAPTAFVIKAIEGTFRRYLPEIAAVRLVDYEPGTPAKAPPAQETGFAPLFRPGPKAPMPAPRGIPGVDLHGLDRADAVRALEAFMDVWGPRVDRVKLVGLEEDAPRRAAEKYLHVYADNVKSRHPEPGRPGVLILHLADPCHNETCSRGMEEEVMPGRILLTRASSSGPPEGDAPA